MTPESIIRGAAADGVALTLSATGTIKVAGSDAAVARWLPEICASKAGLCSALADAFEAFNERAAIHEFDAGMARTDAERVARCAVACRHYLWRHDGLDY